MSMSFKQDRPESSDAALPSTDVARSEPNTLKPDLKLVFEMYVLDHQKARVGAKYELKPSGQVINNGLSGKNEIAVGVRGKFMTEPAPWRKYQYETVEVSQSRVQVMKKKREDRITAAGPSSEPVSPDNLAYREEAFVTEIQFVSYDFFRDASQFEQALKGERAGKGMTPGNEHDPRYRRNRLLILWDDNEQRVKRYMLDGEELEVPKK